MNISEIAKLAGVSSAAVSRYFNNGYISEEKKEAIRKVVEQTGYRPSVQAQTLRTKKTKMIGVIVNVLAVALGGVLGTVFSKKLSTRFTTELNKVFGVCAIGMGISSVPLMQNMPAVTSLVAVPQAAVFFALFFAAKAIYPLTTPTMIGDFKACGGFLLIATGCRIAKMQDFPVADMIPAMVLVMPLSALWTNYIAPLL